MQENHKKFLAHLNASVDAVFTVGKFLCAKGHDIKINGVRRAKSASEWKRYADDGDLVLFYKNQELRIEVKGLSCDFTNAHDWKFKDFIVCAKHSFDNADKQPYAYFILNKEKTHAAIVKSNTSSTWEVVSRNDSRYVNVQQDFYTCNLEHINWVKL